MIPRILHQTWKSRAIPDEIYKPEWIYSWRTHHPDWKYRLWTDQDNRNLIQEHYAWFLPTYDEYPFSIQRADAWRYFVLHHIGGIYVDLDFECFRAVDSLFISGVVLSEKDDGAVTNAIMGSEAGHPFWERVWRQLEHRKHWPVLQSTGPAMLTEVWRDWQGGGISVLDRKYFWQATYRDSLNKREVAFTDEAFGAHRYANSWHTGSRGWMRVKQTVRFTLATFTGSHRIYEAAAGVVRRFRRRDSASNRIASGGANRGP